MKRISANTLLDNTIKQLEIKRAQELILLKANVKDIRESFRPNNIIRDTFAKQTEIGNTVFGLASGFLIKKVLFRKSRNPLKIVARSIIQTAVTGIVANNSDKIHAVGRNLFNTIISKYKHSRTESTEQF